MNEVERLLLEIGAELGRGEAEMRPLIDRVVNECWFDTVESLRQLSSEQDWAPLKLPPRLRLALTAKLGPAPPAPAPGPAPAPAAAPARASAAALASRVPPGEIANTLRRILTNLRFPGEKFRRINVNSEIFRKSILASAAAEETLKALGFRQIGENLEISSFDLPAVNSAINALPAPEAFDPFRPVFTTAAGAMKVPRGAAELRARELAALRAAAEVVTGEPRASLVSLTRDLEIDSPGGEEWDEQLLEEALRSRRTCETFQSREKLEIERTKFRKIFLTVTLRIVFPGEEKALLLEHYFSPADSVGKLIATLREKFLLPGFSWELACPPLKLSRPAATLEEEGLVPTATLRLLVKEPVGFQGRILREGI